MKWIWICLLLVAFTACGWGRTATATTIVNGGFETGDYAGWDLANPYGDARGFQIFSPGLTEGDYYARFVWDGAAEDGPGAWKISQQVAIPASDPVLLFDYTNVLPFEGQSLVVSADVGGSVTVFPIVNGPDVNFTPAEASVDLSAFVGETAILAIEARNLNKTHFVQVDNIRLDYTPVPEPATLLILELGALAALGWRARRRHG